MTWLKKFDQSDEEAWPDQKIYLPTLENTLKEQSYTLVAIETFDQQWWIWYDI